MTAAHAGDLSTGSAALRRAARRWLPRLALAGRVLAPLAVLVVALVYRTPLVASIRGLLLAALALMIPLALALEVRALRRRPGRARRLLVVVWALLLALFVGIEGRFRLAKARVLAAAPADLEAIGEHLVVGFRNLDELRELARRGGVAGVYVSRRNLEGIDPAEIVATLAELQAARRDRGLPPLLVAADQEGGVVSHMSPPLTRLPPLSSLVDPKTGHAERPALLDYADTHGRELRSLGVNVNFAPVVDLRVAVDRAFDRFTKIEARAISDDPEVVAAVADPYCEGLRGQRVACTLKHFPGIGRVREDTHYFAGHLESPRGELEGAEWRPFRALTAGSPPSTLVMLSHTIVDAIDRDLPASMSTPVVGLLRREWGYDGVLVTDDLSMFPISLGPGVGEASVRGLAAGVDLLLISYDPDLYYEAVDELLDRWEELPAEALARSRRRLAALQGWLAAGAS